MADCSPDTLMTAFPCLNCLSQTQLQALKVLVLGELTGYTLPQDLTQLLIDSKSHLPLSQTQKMQSEIVSLLDGAADKDSVAQLVTNATCLQCVSPNQIQSMNSFLTCQYFKEV